MTNKYGLPKYKREELIESAIKISKSTDDLNYGDKTVNCKKIVMPIDSLIYRIENFRTVSRQEDDVANKGLKKNYYRDNPESSEIQEMQHELLVPLTKKGDGATLYKEFSIDGKKQNEPLLINNRGNDGVGIVINGNRRLCAWREAYFSNTNKFSHFKTIDCLVLPANLDAGDEEDIEYALQIKKPLRQDYDWVGDVKAKRRKLSRIQAKDQKTKMKEVANESGIQESRLQNELSALDKAEEYLKDFMNQENRWSLVTEDQQAFFTLAQQMNGLTRHHEKMSLTEMAFHIISKGIRGISKHNAINFAARNRDQLERKITSDKDFSLLDKKDKRESSKKGAKGLPKPKGNINSPIEGFKPGVLSDLISLSIDELLMNQKNRVNHSAELSRINSSLRTLNKRFDTSFAQEHIQDYLTKIQNSVDELQSMKSKLERLKKK